MAVEEHQRDTTNEDRVKERLYQYIYLGFEFHGIYRFCPLNGLKPRGINPNSRQQFKNFLDEYNEQRTTKRGSD